MIIFYVKEAEINEWWGDLRSGWDFGFYVTLL